MSKKIQLSIPTPCHESWDAMTPVEKGKFCGSCQKQVVDFSTMSDRQVVEFFKKPSTGSVCGRFMTDQLDREIEIPKKRIPWLKYFFGILLPAFFMSKASAQKLMGKVAALPNRDTIRVSANEELRTLGMVLPTEIKPVIGDTICVKNSIVNINVINGKVVDENGNPLAFASIVTGKTGKGVAADENGYFILNKIDIGSDMKISVSSVGYEKLTLNIDLPQLNEKNELIVPLKPINELAEVVLESTGFTKGLVCRVGDVYVTRIYENQSDLKPIVKNENKIKVFPNPVPSGSNLTIEWKETEEGYYSFQLLNQSGQSVHQREIWIDDKARLLNLDIPSVAAGNYFIVFTSKKSGKRFSEKIIIQ